ncbi:hypothetical protein ACFL5G_02755 [Candidatus Margulisiibacteriota bacterium]
MIVFILMLLAIISIALAKAPITQKDKLYDAQAFDRELKLNRSAALGYLKMVRQKKFPASKSYIRQAVRARITDLRNVNYYKEFITKQGKDAYYEVNKLIINFYKKLLIAINKNKDPLSKKQVVGLNKYLDIYLEKAAEKRIELWEAVGSPHYQPTKNEDVLPQAEEATSLRRTQQRPAGS